MGSTIRFSDGRPHYTKLAAWLMRLNIKVIYSRPDHPQSKGKNERFNRTLKAEVLYFERFRDRSHAQDHISKWRRRYNTVRPHQALDMQPPASRYSPSNTRFPRALPAVTYGPDDMVRKVSAKGRISFRGELFRVGKAFEGYPVALRASTEPHTFEIYFCNQHIRTITLNKNQ